MNSNQDTDASFDAEAFLEWLHDIDGYYVPATRVTEEWPEFHDHYELTGVTMRYDPETDESLVPVRDYRQCIVFGHPLD